jgi:hypothetical protein
MEDAYAAVILTIFCVHAPCTGNFPLVQGALLQRRTGMVAAILSLCTLLIGYAMGVARGRRVREQEIIRDMETRDWSRPAFYPGNKEDEGWERGDPFGPLRPEWMDPYGRYPN